MPAVRDPLSVTYDPMVRRVLLAAMREGTRVYLDYRRRVGDVGGWYAAVAAGREDR